MPIVPIKKLIRFDILHLMKKSVVILFWFAYLFSQAQTPHESISFTHYSIEDGLSQSTILSIYQDSHYYIWLATLDGLNKFNGVSFKIYYYAPDDTTTISNKWVYDVIEDKEGFLWVATLNGLNKFNRKTEKFIRYYAKSQDPRSLPENTVKGLYIDEHNVLWVRTHNYLVKYVNGEFYSYAIPQESFTLLNTYNKIPIIESEDIIWTTSSKGLVAFHKNTELQKVYSHREGDPLSISDNRVTALAQDVRGGLWVGTLNGLNYFDPATKTFKHFFRADSTGLLDDKINVIYVDNSGRVWIGTNNGLNLYDKKEGIFYAYTKEENNPQSLSNNNVMTIFEDYSHNLWVGTYGGGLNKADLKPKKFKLIRNTFSPYSLNLSSNVIAGLYEEYPDFLWVGTYGDGVNICNLKTNKVIQIKSEGPVFHKLTNNFVHAILQLKNGLIYLGTRNGITVYDTLQNKFFDIRDYYPMVDFPQLENNRIYEMLEDIKHNVWIATISGLFKFSPTYKEVTAYYVNDGLLSNSVQGLYEDEFGKVWIATTKGINIYDLFDNKEQFINFSTITAPDSALRNNEYNKLSNENVYKIVQTKKYYWFGTVGGLNRYDPVTKKIKYYLKKDGLPNENIYEILVDDDDNLWFSTNRGLVFFNTTTNEIKSFDEGDGLQGLEFNKGASAKGKDGRLYFGGLNGINYFYPDSIHENLFIPKISFDQVEIFNVDGQIKIFNVDNRDTVILFPKDKAISISFSSLEFTNPKKNRYKFYLEGLDKNWIAPTSQNFAKYTNLSPGTYTFYVKGSNNDLKWSEKIKLTIIVKPPFWRTIWAYLIYMVVIGGIVTLLIRYRTEKLRRDNELLREKQKAAMEISKARDELAVKNKDLQDSLTYAKRIQQAIMPTQFLLKKYFPESFVYYNPRDIVSGDFYWFVEKDNRFYVAAVDCTGHGVPGAFMSIIGLNMLNNIVNVAGEYRAGKILDELNKSVYDSLNKQIDNVTLQDGMDMAVCVIDLINKKVNYSGAKNPMVLIRNGEYIEIPANRMAIGSFKYDFATMFGEYEFEIEKGDMFYIFSDGYADQFGGPKGKKFKKKNFRDLLLRIHSLPIEEQKEELERTFNEWKGNLPQVDDVLVIGIKLL